jgi:hypothetical protein
MYSQVSHGTGGTTSTNVQLFKNNNFTTPHKAIKHCILRNGRVFLWDENCCTGGLGA